MLAQERKGIMKLLPVAVDGILPNEVGAPAGR